MPSENGLVLFEFVNEVKDRIKEDYDLTGCLPESRTPRAGPPPALLSLLRCMAIEIGVLADATPCAEEIAVKIPDGCAITTDELVEVLADVAEDFEFTGPPTRRPRPTGRPVTRSEGADPIESPLPSERPPPTGRPLPTGLPLHTGMPSGNGIVLFEFMNEVKDRLEEDYDLTGCLPESRTPRASPPPALLTLLRCMAIEIGVLADATPCADELAVK